MRALLAAPEADDVAFLQQLLTFGRAERRLAAEHDHPFLVQVVRVVRPKLAAGLDLGHGRADQLAADALTDKDTLDAPAFAVSRSVPLVGIEVETLHPVNRILVSGGHSRTTVSSSEGLTCCADGSGGCAARGRGRVGARSAQRSGRPRVRADRRVSTRPPAR